MQSVGIVVLAVILGDDCRFKQGMERIDGEELVTECAVK
jgi:hypothetical protein